MDAKAAARGAERLAGSGYGRSRRFAEAVLAFALVAAAGCWDSSPPSNGPCDGVTCSSRGFCVASEGEALCFCMSGFHSEGLECIADDPDELCAGVDCEFHGWCRPVGDEPYCDCELGYTHPPAGDPACAGADCDLICVIVADADADGDADADDGTDAGPDGMVCHEGPSPCPSGTVYVPCGPTVIGSNPGEGDLDEEPKHLVNLSAFCLDTHEVTNGDYAACVSSGTCTPPISTNSATRPAYHGNPTYDGFPVINVDHAQAAEYCGWRGKRLPTEAEWEKGARGGCETHEPPGCGPEDELLFPWGNGEPTCALANFVGCVNDTEPVGSRPDGASVYGAQALAGNVQEWVDDWYMATVYDACADGTCVDPPGPSAGSERVFRGGAWESTSTYLRTTNRFRQAAGYADEHLGFRCAGSIVE